MKVAAPIAKKKKKTTAARITSAPDAGIQKKNT